jgi:hypothetical protein
MVCTLKFPYQTTTPAPERIVDVDRRILARHGFLGTWMKDLANATALLLPGQRGVV